MTRDMRIQIPPGSYRLTNAVVPSCFVERAPEGARRDREGSLLLDIFVQDGVVRRLTPAGAANEADAPAVNLGGRQVWPTLIDMHTHLDKGQCIPRAMADGTLEGGAKGTLADRTFWTPEDIAFRMTFGLRCAYAHGVSTIRTHLDSPPEIAARSFAVFRRLRREWASRVDLQAVGLAPLSVFAEPWGDQLADLVAESGGVLGGVTDALGLYGEARAEALDALLDVFLQAAARRGLDVDLHVDQTDEVGFFALPRIAAAVLRNRFPHRVVCGHCVSLALQPPDTATAAIALCKEAGIHFVTLPTPMMYLQDRKPGRTPRWRGVTLAQELLDAGLKVAVAGDNCRDAWFPFGDHDMLDTLQQAVRVFQIDLPLENALQMAAPMPADIIGASGQGRIAAGSAADFIILRARTMNEAMCRPQMDRTIVRHGKRVDDALPDYSELDGLNRVPA